MNSVESLATTAVAIADSLPGKYQVAGFTEILRFLLNQDTKPNKPLSDPNPVTQGVESTSQTIATGLPAAHVVAKGQDRRKQTVWAVVNLHSRGIEAVNESIREEIEVALAARPQARQNTNRTLGQLTPKYLSRQKRQDGKGYRYVPTAMALEIFEESDES